MGDDINVTLRSTVDANMNSTSELWDGQQRKGGSPAALRSPSLWIRKRR